MKNLRIITSLLMTGMLFSFQSASPFKKISGSASQIFITYGSKAGCFGSGICRIEAENDSSRRIMEGTARGWIWVDSDQRFVLRITIGSMTESTRLQHFTDGYFRMPRSYALPNEVTTRLETSSSFYSLEVGLYKYREDEYFYTITF